MTTKSQIGRVLTLVRNSIRAISVAAAVAFALAGCSGSSSSQSTGSGVGEAGGKISGTVTFWHAYSADSAELKTLDQVLIPKFEKDHPGVKVESVPIPYDNLHQKLVTAVAGDALPDVVRSDIIWVPELADLGAVAPLDQEMPDFQKYADQMYKGPLATNKWKDHYYGLPLDTNTRVLMYNQKTLSAAGINQPPATFEDLKEAAPALKEKGAFTFADSNTQGWNVLPWIWSAGGSITDDDAKKATGHLNSPASVKGIQLLVDLYKQNAIPELILGAKGGTPTSDGLPGGNYATILDGPWMFPIFEKQYPDFDLKTAPVPAGDGGSVSVVGGESVVLTQSSDNKPAAAEFMRFLVSEEAQLEMAKVGQMPVLSSLSDELPKIHEYYAPFVKQIENARPRTPTPAWPRIEEVLRTQVQLALRGEQSAQQSMDQAAAEIDKLLARYNK
ncbi:extracellular solute-binding protein [Arthrobacter sp. CJ23]|uniref:extracellular solute-binding protein n=1 Tax=Arthrobacter sp. CJ23 TaxID=2972479 RepID=UPI00215D1B93|nr:extracellular solute-binding protein [Arthrobacter sp. CJ23]UVJ38638.1 extracellular solute-binding protein [Arthrobacter sp. CJ23]